MGFYTLYAHPKLDICIVSVDNGVILTLGKLDKKQSMLIDTNSFNNLVRFYKLRREYGWEYLRKDTMTEVRELKKLMRDNRNKII